MTQWIEVGGRRIGIRWSSPGLDQGLRVLLGSDLTDGDAPANISVVVGGHEDGVRAKHQLYVQGKLVLVTGSDDRILRAIVRAASDLASEQPPGALVVRAAVVISADGRAILVDRRLGHDLWNLDRRLRPNGCRVIDSAAVAIDVDTYSAVLTQPANLLDGDARTVQAQAAESDGLDDFRGGAIPISRLVFLGASNGESLSESLAEAAPITLQPDYTLRVGEVERLLHVVRGTEFCAVGPDDPSALLAALGPSLG